MNKYLLKYQSYFWIIIIISLHAIFLNYLEKRVFSKNNDKNLNDRPLKKCAKDDNGLSPFKCWGMPSTHAEIIVILSVFLFVKKIISYEILWIFIFIICFQRILFNMHTFKQVVVGSIFGGFYSIIYSMTNYSYLSVLFTLFIIIILALYNFVLI